MITPPFLEPGNKIGIVSTAKRVDKKLLEYGTKILSGWGLEVCLGVHVYEGDYFLAGKDDNRAEDINAMIEDASIRAIFCARGGYGTGRILESIHFDKLKEDPKWVVGFSDITILLLKLTQLGLSSIHGPMPAIYYKTEEEALNQLKELLFGGKPNPIVAEPNRLNRMGNVSGTVTGGNLAMICNSLGTNFEIETKDRILLIEDVDEPLYKIDRMLHQLKSAGKLSDLAGLIVGHITQPEGEDDFDFTIEEIVAKWTGEYKYPIGFEIPIGHESNNFPLPINYPAHLDVSSDGLRLSFKI